MGVNADYFSAIIHYLNALNGEEAELIKFKGKDAYSFQCPFCARWVQTPSSRTRRTAKFIRERGDTWIFHCSRGFDVDCRGGTRSMHNFLLLLNPDLYQEYQFSLAWTDRRNHNELTNYKMNQ